MNYYISSCIIFSGGIYLNFATTFYKDLYTKDSSVKFEYRNSSNIGIDADDRETLDKEITNEDLKKAVKDSKRGKAPGLDGLTTEFYVIFFVKIGNILLEALNYGLQQGVLHRTARGGLLSLIPKKGKDIRKLRNLRPITLLNVDFKILEKILSNRLKVVLDKLISKDQKGFLQNRKIFSNIRRVLDVIEIAERTDIEGIILSLDYF